MSSETSQAPGLLHKASILAIGTELTTGQITNRNAAWLSERLVPHGVEVVLHETVADDRQAIRDALDHCWSVSRIVFVCGGLGPTTDDFTRDVIADWLGKPLEFHEPSWKKIEDRLGRLGIPIASSNRQQAFYPAGATVLLNTQGTANGFTYAVRRGEQLGRIWVLPGPPREIEAIWRDNPVVDTIRRELPEGIEAFRLYSWECLGKSEAELGELTESLLQGSGLTTGYRFHRPYIEVKVWVPESQVEAKAPWIEKLDQAIAPWVVVKNGEDVAQLFLDLLRSQTDSSDAIDFADACSGGFLLERLGPLLRRSSSEELSTRFTFVTEWETPHNPSQWVTDALNQADEEALTFVIAGVTSSGEWVLGMREGSQIRQQTLQSPWPHLDLIERSRTYAVETALKIWRDWLRLSVQ